MDTWIEHFRQEAERMLNLGYVRLSEFSDSTYQIEVFDPQTNETLWPFLQFDEHNRLKDAFCSCLQEEYCVHLAAAYLMIYGGHTEPLHVRFERSFWNHLCRLFADHSGYDEKFLQKQSEGHYLYQNEVSFEIWTKNKEAQKYLSQLVENRLRASPENSIKFSNVAQDRDRPLAFRQT